MINATAVWILLVVFGSHTTTASPNIQQLYKTEKRADCEAQKAKWDAALVNTGVKLRCVEHAQTLMQQAEF